MLNNNCTKCNDDNDGAEFWDFGDERLCQMCWEESCSNSWWEIVKEYDRTRFPNYYLRIKNGWEIIASNYAIWQAYMGHQNFTTMATMREVFWEVLDDRGLNL
jgi:hypothetical protein